MSLAGFCSGPSILLGTVIPPFCLMSVLHIILVIESVIWCWALTPFLSAAINLQLLLTSVGIFFSRFWDYEHWFIDALS